MKLNAEKCTERLSLLRVMIKRNLIKKKKLWAVETTVIICSYNLILICKSKYIEENQFTSLGSR